jgi:hypothetical protein
MIIAAFAAFISPFSPLRFRTHFSAAAVAFHFRFRRFD